MALIFGKARTIIYPPMLEVLFRLCLLSFHQVRLCDRQLYFSSNSASMVTFELLQLLMLPISLLYAWSANVAQAGAIQEPLSSAGKSQVAQQETDKISTASYRFTHPEASTSRSSRRYLPTGETNNKNLLSHSGRCMDVSARESLLTTEQCLAHLQG